MIVKFLLIVWLGVGSSQTLSITKFDTESECTAAKVALIEYYHLFDDDKWVKYTPYSYALICKIKHLLCLHSVANSVY